MDRRQFLFGASGMAGALACGAASAAPLAELRIGYQKTAIPLVVKAQRLLEQRFEPQGVTVKWVEFAFGPPLLGGGQRRRRRLRLHRRRAADLRAGRARQDRLCRGDPGARLRAGDRRARRFAGQDACRPQGQEDRRRQGIERPQSAGLGAREPRTSPGATSTPSISRPPTRPPPSRAARSTPGRSGTRSTRSRN